VLLLKIYLIAKVYWSRLTLSCTLPSLRLSVYSARLKKKKTKQNDRELLMYYIFFPKRQYMYILLQISFASRWVEQEKKKSVAARSLMCSDYLNSRTIKWFFSYLNSIFFLNFVEWKRTDFKNFTRALSLFYRDKENKNFVPV
jgi:hypothetical protein